MTSSAPQRQPDRGHLPRNVQPKSHDPYRAHRKPKGAMRCDMCDVVFHAGRWYWGAPPLADVSGGLCPACQRTADRCPAGTIRLAGLAPALRDEVVAMLRNIEQVEKAEHPLERIMDVETEGDDALVTTTGTHLARRFANAIERRLPGQVAIRYAEEGASVRVEWIGAGA